MGARIIDGKGIAGEVLAKAKQEVAGMASPPCLAIVLVGNNAASQVYVKKKEEACANVGIKSRTVRMPETAGEDEIIEAVRNLNADDSVDGVLVQLPLPRGTNEGRVLEEVLPEKDADGIHPLNIGKLSLGMNATVACTPKGVMYLLKKAGVALEGKHAVVIGRSRIVGKPLSMLLLNENCTVTVCHSRTNDLASIARQADVLCVAVGKARVISADMVKEGAVVIDIGTNRVGNRLVGDVDFEAVKEKASLITPVPGGVGPMTVAMLIESTIECAKGRRGGG